MVEGIDTNYGGFRDTNGFDIEKNLIKYTSNDGIALNGTNNSTVKNNTIVMAGYNLEVYGHNNLIQGNIIQTNNTGDLSTYTGIEEGQQPNTHDNQFINNRATGIVFVKHRVTYTPPKFPVYIVGRNSTGRGNVLIPRPAWPI